MTSILGDYISIMNCWSYLLSTRPSPSLCQRPRLFPPTTFLTTAVFQVQSASPVSSPFPISQTKEHSESAAVRAHFSAADVDL
jgi:hypothetical protein